MSGVQKVATKILPSDEEVSALESLFTGVGLLVVLAIVFRITGMNYFKLEIGRNEPPPKQLKD